MKLGFIGLGNMGAAMAGNLVRAGHEVIVYNRTRSKAEALARAGATAATEPGELAAAEAVITMLADDAAVRAVALAGDRPGAAFGRGAVHVSASTISAQLARELAEIHARAGGALVSAPVFGRPDAAAAAKLYVVAAGPAAAVARAQPIFDAIGQRTFVVGEEPAAANVLKLAGNYLIASTIEAMAEAFALVRKWGLDPAAVLDVLTSTLFTAPIHKGYGGMIARGAHDAAGGFALRLGLKDVRLALAAADAVGAPMPTASVVHDQMTAAIGRGLGDLDWSAIARLVAGNAGL